MNKHIVSKHFEAQSYRHTSATRLQSFAQRHNNTNKKQNSLFVFKKNYRVTGGARNCRERMMQPISEPAAPSA